MSITKERREEILKERGISVIGGRPKGALGRHTMDKIEAHKWWVAAVIKDLPKIYNALAEKAFAGDVLAIKELMDRAFGKSVTPLAVSDNAGQPIVFLPLALIEKHALQDDDNVSQLPPVDVTKDVITPDNGSTKP